MPKLLITGVYYPGGGLSNVMEQLAHHLGSHFEVTCLGFIPPGVKSPDSFVDGCKFIAEPVHQLFRVKNPDTLHQLIYEQGCDNVLILGPVYLNQAFIKQLIPFNVQMIAYTAYEGKMKHTYDIEHLKQLDYCFFYTEHDYLRYAEILLEGGYEKEVANNAGFIGHGTDPSFYPLHENSKTKRKSARMHIDQHAHLPEDAFIILNSNRPYYRKRLDLSLEAFRLFSEGKQNVYLHFHLGFASPEEIELLEKEIDEAGLNEIVFLTSSSAELPLSKEWMNMLYNACDVGITTSMGEGWGMGLFEHAATNAPIIAPAHTSFIENWQGVGLLADTHSTQFVFYENAEMFETNPASIARPLLTLYNERELLEKVAKRCREKVSSNSNWQNTANVIALQINSKRSESKQLINTIQNGKRKDKRTGAFDTRLHQ